LKKFPFFCVFVHSFMSWFYQDDPIPPPNSGGKANRLACERQHYCKNQRTLNASKLVGWPGPPPHPTGRSATAMKVVVIVVTFFLWS